MAGEIISARLRLLRRTNLHTIEAMRLVMRYTGANLHEAKNTVELAMAHPSCVIDIFAVDFAPLSTAMEECGFALLRLDD